ncbi:MAG: ABC transporter permease [Gammaproteobacteria bacterium]
MGGLVGSLRRFWGIVIKELVQMRRDRLTFAMMIGMPLIQLTLFGFAINNDPRRLPTAVLLADHSAFARSLIAGMQQTAYFHVLYHPKREDEARALLRRGDVQFVLAIPAGFSRQLVRGDFPAVLLEIDATDPAAASNAVAAVNTLILDVLNRDLQGTLQHLQGRRPPFELRIHRHFNPEGLTRYNIVPGLMGVVLTMTMVLMTGLAMTRERERGTMENLLAMPVRPLEVMLGKIVPYVFVGYLQAGLILVAARLVFDVPMLGDLTFLALSVLVFIAANLTLGLTFSTIARNQLQAMQMGFFFFLPSILLSGFMFPFRGMPEWAQTLGELLPLTHFLRLVRGILLKGYDASEVLPHLWPMLAFLLVALVAGRQRYRRTLD